MDKIFFTQKNENQPLYLELYQSIVDDIMSQELKANDRMPSIRELAKRMGISRTTIENTYGQLMAEGYIYSRAKVGYFVTPMAINENTEEEEPKENKSIDPETKKNRPIYDFVSEYVEYKNFDMALWKRNINKVINEEERELFRLGNPFGEESLRESISRYFSRMRGVMTTPEQVIIGQGTHALLRTLSYVLKEDGFDTLSIENPGYNTAKNAFGLSGFKLEGISLKNGVMDVEELTNKKDRICFTSPSYQFPYGEVMPMNSRLQLLEWAKDSGSYIIEDDYNSELRYVGRPIASLQGMDRHHRVIYLGSFSTLLLPSIRISFMILPQRVHEKYIHYTWSGIQGPSKLEQRSLAKMIDSGDFAKHIRRLRKNYRKKQEHLMELVESHLMPYVTPMFHPAGISCVLKTKTAFEKERLNALLTRYKIKVSTVSEFMIEAKEQRKDRFLFLNYRGLNEEMLENAILTLKEVLCRL